MGEKCHVCGGDKWVGFQIADGDLTTSCAGCGHSRVLPQSTQRYYNRVFQQSV